MLPLSKLLRILGVMSLTFLAFLVIKPASAATSTVCATGCDFTTLADALSYATNTGDVVSVEADYDESLDTATYPITTLEPGVTIDCQNSGAVIGQTSPAASNVIYLTQNSTIRRCTFGNISLYASNENPTGIQILDNVFSTTATSTIEFNMGGVNNFLIQGNTNINGFRMISGATSTGGVIQENTFYFRDVLDFGTPFSVSVLSSDVDTLTVASNTFESATTLDVGRQLIDLGGVGMTFVTNTVRFLVSPHEMMAAGVLMTGSGNNTFSGNIIDAPDSFLDDGGCVAAQFELDTDTFVQWNVSHNTLRIPSDCFTAAGVNFYDGNHDGGSVQVEFYYNLLYRDGNGHEDDEGIRLEKQSALSAFSFNDDYNAVYAFSSPFVDKNENTGASLGVHTYELDPHLRTENVSVTDDHELAPFSPYLDINGSEDIGAISGVRTTSIDIDASGIVNYTTVDGTDTEGIGALLRSGDTLNLADGVYSPFSVSSTMATTSISIIGTGDSVVIDGNLLPEDGIRLENVTSSSVVNVTIQNASSTAPGSYLIDLVNGVYLGTSYDEASGDVGSPASSTIIFVPGGDGPPEYYTANGYDVTSIVHVVPEDWHLALLTVGAAHVTALVPNSMATSAWDLEDAGEGMFTVEAFATSTLVYDVGDQTFSFDQTALDDAGITLAIWASVTPELAFVPGARLSGIRLNSSQGITLTNVTSTNNGNGISFGLGSSGNIIEESYFSGSTEYDLNYESADRNTFDNVTFDVTSSTFSGVGDVLVKFDARVYTDSSDSGLPLENVEVTATDASLVDTSFGLTDALGYTAYTSLPAFVMSSSSIAHSNGGFNNYTFSAVSSTYAPGGSTLSLISPNLNVSLTLWPATGPNAPTAAGAAHVSTSTATFGWIDNASDEDSFSVEYRRPLVGEEYPGTTLSVTGVAYVDMTGLTPGEQYEFRVAAVNVVATSTYSTSTVFTMSAAPASAPTLTALSRTSLSIDLGTSSNATSVEYAIYSSTLSGYLDAAAAVTGSPVWQTSSTWSTLTVPALTCGTNYTFSVIARNVEEAESATSTASTVATSACASVPVSGGGGGGGGAIGGGGGGASGPIQTFFNTPPVSPPISTPLVQAPDPTPVPAPVNPEPSPAADLSPLVLDPRVRTQVVAVLALQKDQASEEAIERLTAFVQYGTTPQTRALGLGERLAVLKDLCETTGRVDVLTSDLERMAQGEIPRTRNLRNEQLLAPRALATFKTMFGHAPNFKDPAENLAWNTLMYRIRFPRNLVREREGILIFKKLFGRNPSDPFQWSVVRVLGYVR